MVRLKHSQRSLGEVFFAREAEALMEAWMKEADQIVEDEGLLISGKNPAEIDTYPFIS